MRQRNQGISNISYTKGKRVYFWPRITPITLEFFETNGGSTTGVMAFNFKKNVEDLCAISKLKVNVGSENIIFQCFTFNYCVYLDGFLSS